VEDFMGTSNSISDQEKLNAEFTSYIDSQTKVLDQLTSDAQTAIDATITTYYQRGGWDDAKPLVAGSYQHLSTASEWSLDSLAKMIDGVRDSIFGKEPPKGTTASPLSGDLATNVAKMAGMNVLIASAAFDAIQGVLAAFTSSTQTSVKKDYVTKLLAPGLTLFCCIIENQYSRSDFLANNTIVQNAYVFATRFSIKQAGDISKFNDIQALEAQKWGFRDQLAKVNAAVVALDPTTEDYATKLAKYTAIGDTLNSRLQVLQAAIDEKEKVAAASAARMSAAITQARRVVPTHR
jgi:hypothetical protein